MELSDEQYQRYRINYLYHFTHMDHFASILAHGIMPRNRAQYRGYIAEDISNQGVQARRASKQVFGRPLHNYVPLYFTPRNPMLFVLNARKDIQNELVILCLRKELLCREGSIFTDGNAASEPTTFFNTIDDLDQLYWDCIRADRWNVFSDGTRKRCAEVLVLNYISTYDIQRAVVKSEETGARIAQTLEAEIAGGRRLLTNIQVDVQPRWFFDE